MARTRKAVGLGRRAEPIDLVALRAQIKSIEGRVSYTVPITVKIQAEQYKAIVEACDKYGVRFADMVRRSIAEGLAHMTEFVTPFEQPFEPPTYRPGRGMNRAQNAYEEVIGQRAPRESEIDMSDDLARASVPRMQAGAPRRGAARAPSARVAAIASALDEDDTPVPLENE